MSTQSRNKTAPCADRLRDEYLNVLMQEPMIGTTFGGDVERFGFPSAVSVINGITAEQQVAKVSTLHRPAIAAAASRAARPAEPSPIEMFASMLEVVGRGQQSPEREKVVA